MEYSVDVLTELAAEGPPCRVELVGAARPLAALPRDAREAVRPSRGCPLQEEQRVLAFFPTKSNGTDTPSATLSLPRMTVAFGRDEPPSRHWSSPGPVPLLLHLTVP